MKTLDEIINNENYERLNGALVERSVINCIAILTEDLSRQSNGSTMTNSWMI